MYLPQFEDENYTTHTSTGTKKKHTALIQLLFITCPTPINKKEPIPGIAGCNFPDALAELSMGFVLFDITALLVLVQQL
jgi:hypothetical protein